MTAKDKETTEKDNKVADFTEAQNRKGKVRVRLPQSVTYEGETLDELWMRRPVVLDGIVASNQAGDSNNALSFGMAAQCAGVDLDWLWDQPPAITNKLLKAYSEDLKDPTFIPEWDGLKLKLQVPFDVKGKTLESVTLRAPTTRDLMDDSSKEKMYEMVARLLDLTVADIREMDYLHDYIEIVKKVQSFRGD